MGKRGKTHESSDKARQVSVGKLPHSLAEIMKELKVLAMKSPETS